MLDKERQYYATHLQEWLKTNPGSFVVVKDDTLVGFFDTHDEALAAGAARFGLSSFLVRRVAETEEAISVPALSLGLSLYQRRAADCRSGAPIGR